MAEMIHSGLTFPAALMLSGVEETPQIQSLGTWSQAKRDALMPPATAAAPYLQELMEKHKWVSLIGLGLAFLSGEFLMFRQLRKIAKEQARDRDRQKPQQAQLPAAAPPLQAGIPPIARAS